MNEQKQTAEINQDEINWTKRGILKQHENQTLLNSPSEPLNVPITQVCLFLFIHVCLYFSHVFFLFFRRMEF